MRRRKRYLDNTAPADNTVNVVRPVIIQRNNDIKARSPERQKAEQQKADYIAERNNRIVSTFARTPAGRRAANRAYAIESQKAKQEAAKEEAAAVVGSLFKPLMPSTYVDMAAAIKNGQINNLTDALAAPYLTDSWSMRNPGKALALDVVLPIGIGGGAKLVDRGTRGLRLSRAMDRGLSEVPEGFTNVKPTIRTRLGDVEIDNPNLMYHQKKNTLSGMFGINGSGSKITKEGVAPGAPKVEGQPGYVWFNKGKPYVNDTPEYLVTTSASNPNLIHVRSQNYPIGQWNGQNGFVTNSEYVSSNPVKGTIYRYDPNYGYRRVTNNIDESNIIDFERKYAQFQNVPFYYNANGDFIPNPNYYYRRGWGIIDDAQQTGVIRVPPGDYKAEALKKYPWLDNGNIFSTALMNHKFPYFSEGKLWNSMGKFGVEPEDLIAIHKNAGGAQWVAGSKWGALKPEAKPSEYGGRGTPLINGETNKFPTSQAKLFRLNKETNRYEPASWLLPFLIGGGVAAKNK